MQATSTSRPDIRENAFLSFRPQQLAEQALLNEARGSACFDMSFYQHSNPDLASYSRPELLWQHFLRHGQFEGRPHRYVPPGLDGNWGALAVRTLGCLVQDCSGAAQH
jgi:hypothetical protein